MFSRNKSTEIYDHCQCLYPRFSNNTPLRKKHSTRQRARTSSSRISVGSGPLPRVIQQLLLRNNPRYSRNRTHTTDIYNYVNQDRLNGRSRVPPASRFSFYLFRRSVPLFVPERMNGGTRVISYLGPRSLGKFRPLIALL